MALLGACLEQLRTGVEGSEVVRRLKGTYKTPQSLATKVSLVRIMAVEADVRSAAMHAWVAAFGSHPLTREYMRAPARRQFELWSQHQQGNFVFGDVRVDEAFRVPFFPPTMNTFVSDPRSSMRTQTELLVPRAACILTRARDELQHPERCGLYQLTCALLLVSGRKLYELLHVDPKPHDASHACTWNDVLVALLAPCTVVRTASARLRTLRGPPSSVAQCSARYGGKLAQYVRRNYPPLNTLSQLRCAYARMVFEAFRCCCTYEHSTRFTLGRQSAVQVTLAGFEPFTRSLGPLPHLAG